MKGKSFSVLIITVEQYQRTFIKFSLDENGEHKTPSWDDDDERWDTEGFVILKDKGKAMSKKDYDMLLVHYEDDWYDWEDVFIELSNESSCENSEEES